MHIEERTVDQINQIDPTHSSFEQCDEPLGMGATASASCDMEDYQLVDFEECNCPESADRTETRLHSNSCHLFNTHQIQQRNHVNESSKESTELEREIRRVLCEATEAKTEALRLTDIAPSENNAQVDKVSEGKMADADAAADIKMDTAEFWCMKCRKVSKSPIDRYIRDDERGSTFAKGRCKNCDFKLTLHVKADKSAHDAMVESQDEDDVRSNDGTSPMMQRLLAVGRDYLLPVGVFSVVSYLTLLFSDY